MSIFKCIRIVYSVYGNTCTSGEILVYVNKQLKFSYRQVSKCAAYYVICMRFTVFVCLVQTRYGRWASFVIEYAMTLTVTNTCRQNKIMYERNLIFSIDMWMAGFFSTCNYNWNKKNNPAWYAQQVGYVTCFRHTCF